MGKTSTEYSQLLAARAAKGDELAFGELVKQTQHMVYNLALRICRNEEDAEDITQEVYIKAWRSLVSFRSDASFTTWLFRITQNACLDFMRKNGRTQTISLTVESEEGERDEIDIACGRDEQPEGVYEKKERSQTVKNALDLLSTEHKEILVLRDIEGYSYQEISEMLRLDIGTVKSRINRARAKVKEFLLARNFL